MTVQELITQLRWLIKTKVISDTQIITVTHLSISPQEVVDITYDRDNVYLEIKGE